MGRKDHLAKKLQHLHFLLDMFLSPKKWGVRGPPGPPADEGPALMPPGFLDNVVPDLSPKINIYLDILNFLRCILTRVLTAVLQEPKKKILMMMTVTTGIVPK